MNRTRNYKNGMSLEITPTLYRAYSPLNIFIFSKHKRLISVLSVYIYLLPHQQRIGQQKKWEEKKLIRNINYLKTEYILQKTKTIFTYFLLTHCADRDNLLEGSRHSFLPAGNIQTRSCNSIIRPPLQILPVMHHLKQIVGSVYYSFSQVYSVRHVGNSSAEFKYLIYFYWSMDRKH